MIIKSMSRKSPSFGQLINYMADVEKSQQKYFVYHNIYGRKAADLEAEFVANAKFVQRRKNGVYLYHEILSIKSPESLAKETQKELLRDIAYDYAKQRADSCMVFGALHDDHDDHLHYHLLISANHCGQAKKHRMTKAEFDSFKKTLEAQVLSQYPQLQQGVVINRQAGEKLSNKGSEIKRRTGQTPQRDYLKAKLESIFSTAQNKQSFFESMSAANLEIYARGKTLGVRDLEAERNHRLATLGLLDDFNELSKRIELGQAAQASTKSKPKATEQEDAPKAPRDNLTDRVKAKARNTEDNRSNENNQSNQGSRVQPNEHPPAGDEPPQKSDGNRQLTAAEKEAARRKSEMKERRENEASKAKEQSSRKQKRD